VNHGVSMKLSKFVWLVFAFGAINAANAEEFNPDKFANDYFNAWVATQSPTATKHDLENYLSFLAEDVGHQHLPYDPDDSRSSTGKKDIREGMSYYLGAHTEYEGRLISHTEGHNVVVIKYESSSKGIHPQTKEEVSQQHLTVEVLEIENGKVSVIRKYSE
jgi:ketosteroid isomerase-like protein